MDQNYHRYHIETKNAPNLEGHPHRFNVKVNRLALAKLLLKEMVHYKGNIPVVKSRPCVYGVFSGPIGGFAPLEHLCVGCLRCTTQYPDVVQIYRNPKRNELGDGYFVADYVDTVTHEAESGRIPIRGAGYSGKFGGEGWDGMWTDMSEIVRPTRDGIHGREYISLQVDIGSRTPYLRFDSSGRTVGAIPKTFQIEVPLMFDVLPENVSDKILWDILGSAANQLQTSAIVPLSYVQKMEEQGPQIIPLVTFDHWKGLEHLKYSPQAIELERWNSEAFKGISEAYLNAVVIVRCRYGEDLLKMYKEGARVYHLIADYHGRGEDDRFVLDLIREAHNIFVKAQCRGEVTLIGSGGIVLAEHVAKAIICGLDAVALDTPVLVALQAHFDGICVSREKSRFKLPSGIKLNWGTQRLKNIVAAWADQMLEILGAMGLREVRRLRGEMGRAMFQKDLEKEAFKEISGYET